MTDVTRADVERFLRDVAAGRSAGSRAARSRGRSRIVGGQGVATRTVGMLGSVFTFAVARGLRPDNPVRGVKRFADEKRERFLAPAEWARQAAAHLSASQTFVFPGVGHDVIGNDGCAVELARAFLDAPDEQAEAHCFGQLGGAYFDYSTWYQ